MSKQVLLVSCSTLCAIIGGCGSDDRVPGGARLESYGIAAHRIVEENGQWAVHLYGRDGAELGRASWQPDAGATEIVFAEHSLKLERDAHRAVIFIGDGKVLERGRDQPGFDYSLRMSRALARNVEVLRAVQKEVLLPGFRVMADPAAALAQPSTRTSKAALSSSEVTVIICDASGRCYEVLIDTHPPECDRYDPCCPAEVCQ